MVSYVERLIYSNIKSAILDGMKVLSWKRFLPYTVSVLIISISVTFFAFFTIAGVIPIRWFVIISQIEVAVSVGIVLLALIAIKVKSNIERLKLFTLISLTLFVISLAGGSQFLNYVVLFFFYSWIVSVNLVTFILIRDFLVSWPGWFLNLGNPKGNILFSPIVKIIVILSLSFFIYFSLSNFLLYLSLIGIATASLIFFAVFFFSKKGNEIFSTSISFFYIFALYHLSLSISAHPIVTGFFIVDILMIAITTLFSAQAISKILSHKRHVIVKWDIPIILILGLALGYHSIALYIALGINLVYLFVLYHQLSFLFCSLTIVIAFLFYTHSKKMKNYYKSETKVEDLVHGILHGAGKEIVSGAVEAIKEKWHEGGWKIEFKKRKD